MYDFDINIKITEYLLMMYKKNEKFFNDKDVFLASFPRSGNTWMRLLLSDLILQLQGFSTDTGGNIIPDVYRVDVEEWNRDTRINQLPFRIIKTHELCQDSYKRIIYIFRNPADSLCSLYHYVIGRFIAIDEDPGINEFCRIYMDKYCTHLKSYIDAKKKNSDKIVFVSYEKLKDSPVEVLQKISNFLSLQITQQMYQKALENQDFKKLKSLTKLEEPSKLGFSEPGGYQNFFRQGKVNNAEKELSIDTIELIESHVLEIYELAKVWET